MGSTSPPVGYGSTDGDIIWTSAGPNAPSRYTKGLHPRPNTPPGRPNGLSVFGAAMLIAGEMAGSGVLALPKAIVDSGWIGLLLILVLCFNAAYGGTRLGKCWEIIEERFPEYKGSTRNPYPTIAYRAVGRWGSIIVSGSIQITLFGAGVVYLLLASQIVQDIFAPFLPGVTFCTWFLLFAALITPPMWLGSPKDFWFVGIAALMTTTFACIFMFVQIWKDGMSTEIPPALHEPHSFSDFFLSFGIILFSFGGASTFPTIQNDMKDRTKFSKSLVIAFVVILLLYLPITYGAYFVYGDLAKPNIILSLGKSFLVTSANVFMACHLILAFLIVVNPVALEIENIFDVPHEFCWLRCIARSVMVLLMVIIGESIPEFAKLLALVGGSTVAILTFVLPNYFYMSLCDQTSGSWSSKSISLHERIYMWELILIGLLGGAASTYAAFLSIFSSDSISRPCWS